MAKRIFNSTRALHRGIGKAHPYAAASVLASIF